MEHRQIIDWAVEATQELLQKQGNIQETDIRDRIIEKFNSKRQRDYTSDKEHENRSDLIVYHKGKPYLIYEFKKYFKPIRKSDIAESRPVPVLKPPANKDPRRHPRPGSAVPPAVQKTGCPARFSADRPKHAESAAP